MLRILTYQVPTVVAALNTSLFRKLGVHVIAASSTDDLMKRASSIQPQVVIVLFTGRPANGDLANELRSRGASDILEGLRRAEHVPSPQPE